MVQHRSRSHPGGPGAGGGQQSTTVHNVYTGHQVTTDQGLVTMCQCSTFLDPYPTGQTAQWRLVPELFLCQISESRIPISQMVFSTSHFGQFVAMF